MLHIGDNNIINMYIGDKLVERVYKGDTLIFRCDTAIPLLPSEYQQVEYIESVGYQYINMLVNCDTNCSYDVTFEFTELDRSVRYIIGNMDAEKTIGVGVYAGNSQVSYRYGPVFLNTSPIEANQKYNIKYPVVEGDYAKGYLNNIENVSFDKTESDCENPVYIFCRYPVNVEGLSKMKLYDCKIYYEGILIRNLIPCYHKSNDITGLYDTVNDVFYTNEGSGTFLKGPNV